MNCFQVEENAGDFLAGRLTPAQAEEVSGHLAGCLRCRLQVEELRILLEAAGELPRSVEPPRDLWPGVLNRIEGRAGRPERVEAAPRPYFRPAPLLATAAAALLLLLAGRELLIRFGSVSFSYSGLDSIEALDLEFEPLLEYLKADLPQEERLPETAARSLKEGLSLVDRAIAETKAAAEHYPGEPDLRRRLAGSYEIKLELLRRTAEYTGGNEVLY
jgi:hypothetical protein